MSQAVNDSASRREGMLRDAGCVAGRYTGPQTAAQVEALAAEPAVAAGQRAFKGWAGAAAARALSNRILADMRAGGATLDELRVVNVAFGVLGAAATVGDLAAFREGMRGAATIP
jgi:hypothetical protein